MRQYLKKTCTVVFIFVLLALTVSGKPVMNEAASYSAIKVHYMDVGESDCTLIESSGEFMLIDAGDIHDDDKIVNYLKEQGVKRLEYVILTHPHADHIGGASAVVDKFNIGKIILPAKENTTKTFETLLDTVRDKGLKITKPVVGQKYSIGSATFTIIAPNQYGYGSNLNDYSVGLRLTNGKNSFLFIGDAEKEAISDILKNGIDLKSDVLLLGHHGSATSTTKEFLNRVNPKYAVISVGDNNYGHPSAATLKLIADKGSKAFRTDENGTIVATGNGTNITFNAKAARIMAGTQSKTSTVYITKSGKKYHLGGCPSLSKSKIKITLKQAKANGFTPCSKCNPSK